MMTNVPSGTTFAVDGTVAVAAADAMTVNSVIVPQTKVVSFVLNGADAATAGNYGTVFFVADAAYSIVSVTERHAVLGTSGAPVTGVLTVTPSATATSGGTGAHLSAVDLKGANNTNASPSITSPVVSSGSGLSFNLTGTPTSISGVCVSVSLKRV